MDFKNEKSKLYSLGDNILSIAILVLSIAYFMNRSNSVLADKFFIMQQISLSLLLILRGSKKIFATKNRKGYFDCIFGVLILVIILIVFIVELLVK